MFKKQAKHLVDVAVENGAARSENAEEYTYGLNIFLTVAANICTAAAIGVLMNSLIEMLLFIVVYKSLRKYIGGSHSKTVVSCYISSCITYIIAVVIIKLYPLSPIMTNVAVLASVVIIYLIAPVEADKKPLDDKERMVFRCRSRISITVMAVIFLILHYIPFISYSYHYSIVVAVGICAVTIFAIEGKLHQLNNN